MTATGKMDRQRDGQKKKRQTRQTTRHETPSWELLSTDTVEKKMGVKIAKEKKTMGGEKQISRKLSLGADLETDGHNKGGGNIPEATQPH